MYIRRKTSVQTLYSALSTIAASDGRVVEVSRDRTCELLQPVEPMRLRLSVIVASRMKAVPQRQQCSSPNGNELDW